MEELSSRGMFGDVHVMRGTEQGRRCVSYMQDRQDQTRSDEMRRGIMGFYGPGLSFGQVMNMEKERIKHALQGELMVDEDENGFVYKKAPKEKCDRFILGAFDNAVHSCIEAYKFGRVYDYILEKNGIQISMQDIALSKAIEDCKPEDYQYEPFYDDLI